MANAPVGGGKQANFPLHHRQAYFCIPIADCLAHPDRIRPMIVLGIETSCDETAAAVVNDKREILANRVLSQLDDHRPYGGVVPEIAARAHLEHLDRLVAEAMDDAGVDFDDLDAVACTGGPGLIGGVMVGTMTA